MPVRASALCLDCDETQEEWKLENMPRVLGLELVEVADLPYESRAIPSTQPRSSSRLIYSSYPNSDLYRGLKTTFSISRDMRDSLVRMKQETIAGKFRVGVEAVQQGIAKSQKPIGELSAELAAVDQAIRNLEGQIDNTPERDPKKEHQRLLKNALLGREIESLLPRRKGLAKRLETLNRNLAGLQWAEQRIPEIDNRGRIAFTIFAPVNIQRADGSLTTEKLHVVVGGLSSIPDDGSFASK